MSVCRKSIKGFCSEKRISINRERTETRSRKGCTQQDTCLTKTNISKSLAGAAVAAVVILMGVVVITAAVAISVIQSAFNFLYSKNDYDLNQV